MKLKTRALKLLRSEEFRWLALALALHLLAAVLSIGYHQLDEQFQVLEFLNHRLGREVGPQFAGEFREHARSSLLPLFYEVFVRAMRASGIESPASWALGLRILSSLIGWSGLVLLGRYARATLPAPSALWVYRLGALLFCIPYLHARTSSENLSGGFAAIGVLVYLLQTHRRPAAIGKGALLEVGACLGLAFGFRYQVGLLGLLLATWAALIQKQKPERLAWLALGAAVAVALNVALDSWAYGVFTFAPWHALRSQAFGWAAVPPLAIVFSLPAVVFWIRYPKEPLTWATAPFALSVVFMEPKELRLLFPIVGLLPLLIVKALHGGPELKPLRRFVGGINALALVVLTLKPASTPPRIWDEIFKRRGEILELHYSGQAPYEVEGLQAYFYKPEGLRLVSYPSREEMLAAKPRWVFNAHHSLPGCKLVASAFPDWMRALEDLRGPGRFAYKGSIFRCDQ